VTRTAVDAEALAAVVSAKLGAPHRVEHLARLSGGASRETWSFTAVHADGHRAALVLRRDPPTGTAIAPPVDECALIEAAAAAGVPVAPVRFRLTPDDGLGSGFVSDFVGGETLGRRIVHHERFADARVGLAAECGRILAALHAVPTGEVPLAPPAAGRSSAGVQLDLFEQVLDGYDVARPVLELALRWLRTNAPTEPRRVVVHGDFRLGNLLVEPDGVRAVLDWELAHLGDPAEDVGWLCTRSWRFGGAGRVGGVGDLGDLLDAYRAASGEVIDPDHVRYWEVLGNLRWAVIAMIQAFSHLQGTRRSVELAAIGRRVAEAEHDLMELLG
jgi:aminoglycoside phosphotransferase (APT) family kinase protein